MSTFLPRFIATRSVFVFAVVSGLLLAACDHAKDLVEQGKKQAADIQKSIEGKQDDTTSSSASSSSTTGLPSPVATNPVPAATPAATPLPKAPTKDPALLAEFFMKADPAMKSDQMLHELGAIPENLRARITECDLAGSAISDAGLAEVAKFPNLVLVDLSRCRGVSDSGLTALKDLTGLTVLKLDSSPVGDAGMVHLGKLAQLKVLNLNSTSVTDAGIARLPSLSQLEELYISATRIDGSGFRKAPLGSSLRILAADGSAFGEQGLSGLKGHRDLEEVNLKNAQVSDKTIGALKGCAKLRILKLSLNPITDVGIKQLTGLTSLEEITLGTTVASDNCLPTFKVCKNLKFFGDRDSRITPAGEAALKKFCPNVVFDNKN